MNLPKAKNPACAELARAAERELTAFFSAATEMFGADNAKVAAEEWLERFRAIQLPMASSEDACRQVTVAAAVCLGRGASLKVDPSKVRRRARRQIRFVNCPALGQ